jgi:hypothetical protein
MNFPMTTKSVKERNFSEDYAKCVSIAINVGRWMKESVTVFQSNKTDLFYFRLEGDPRPIIKRDREKQVFKYSPESGKCRAKN